MKTYIVCTSCEEEHLVSELDKEHIDIQQDMLGHDVLIYKCPVTGRISRAFIRNRIEEVYESSN